MNENSFEDLLETAFGHAHTLADCLEAAGEEQPERVAAARALLLAALDKLASAARAGDHSRRLLEADVEAAAAECRQLLVSITDYVYEVTIKGEEVIATVHGPGCLPATGYCPEDYENDPLLWHRMVHDDDKAAVENHIKHQ